MDCTYRTNISRLPLLDVVGIDSTNKTFTISFSFLSGEQEPDYIWALEHLKRLYDGVDTPKVFAVDRDLALIHAIQTVSCLLPSM